MNRRTKRVLQAYREISTVVVKECVKEAGRKLYNKLPKDLELKVTKSAASAEFVKISDLYNLTKAEKETLKSLIKRTMNVEVE